MVVGMMIAMGGVIAVSNILVQYPLGEWLTYGALTYPVAFLITDVATRQFGPGVARRVILVGFLVGIVSSLIGVGFGLTTLRIAIASATAFVVGQFLDMNLYIKLQKLPWWQTPVISSTVASVVDTVLFFGIAFSTVTYGLMPDGNVWATELVPLLGIGREFPLWVSLAMADLGMKLVLSVVLLCPYRLVIK
jgi:uncharacterized PurR-regulated membrane protein YhhQ (DUF165 family)